MTGGNYSAHRRVLGADFSRPNARRADALHQPFRQHGDGLLAECFRLELAAEQQSGRTRRLDGQQRRDDLQWHQLSEPHIADGKPVLPSGQSLKRWKQRIRHGKPDVFRQTHTLFRLLDQRNCHPRLSPPVKKIGGGIWFRLVPLAEDGKTAESARRSTWFQVRGTWFQDRQIFV